ncbi:MAG: hypothetical protein K2I10_08870 [Lachnospiraceae bacterium]|nr:hypothetical protein [Lachnospiraceae bacterium]
MKNYKGLLIALLLSFCCYGCGPAQMNGQENTAIEDGKDINEVDTENAVTTEMELPEEMPVMEPAYRVYEKTYEKDALAYYWIRTYDEKDNLIKEEKMDVFTDECTEVVTYAYCYNEAGFIVLKFEQDLENYWRYRYDEEGKLNKILTFENGEYIKSDCCLYDDNGELLYNYTVYDFSSEEDIEKGRMERDAYEYNADGEVTVTHSYNEEGELSYDTKYEYDKLNRVVRIDNIYYFADEAHEYQTITYEGNREIRNYYLVKEDESEKLYGAEIKEFDEEGRCIRQSAWENDIQTGYTTYEYENIKVN